MKSTKADVIFKDFWRVNEHFADLFNTVVFHGKEILKPEILEEMDTDVSGVIEMKDYKGGFQKQLELKKFKLFFLCIMHKEEGEENDKPRVVQSKQKEIM